MQHDDADDANHGREISDPHWARLIFMLVYWLLGGIAFCLAALLGVAQLIVLWSRGRRHEGLESSGALLARYACDCLRYIVFAGDEKPFPLGPLPRE